MKSITNNEKIIMILTNHCWVRVLIIYIFVGFDAFENVVWFFWTNKKYICTYHIFLVITDWTSYDIRLMTIEYWQIQTRHNKSANREKLLMTVLRSKLGRKKAAETVKAGSTVSSAWERCRRLVLRFHTWVFWEFVCVV